MNISTVSSDRRYVSPLQVARALGVSETSVKRWVDEGKLPAQRTEGGHRRILVSDVLAYVSQRNWPHVDLNLLVGSTRSPAVVEVSPLVESFHDSLIQDDSERARMLLLDAQQNGLSMARLADEVISPVMARIGQGWAQGNLDVYHEHRATQVCLSALLAVKMRQENGPELSPEKPLAIGGSPEGDHYLLPSLLIEMGLRELGWRVVNIGPNTPFGSFLRILDERKPQLLWLSCSHVADPEQFVEGFHRLYENVVRHGVAVSVGGRALTSDLRERLTFTHHGDRMSHLAAFAQQLASHRR
ncbi:MAG: helix-turn-helix domain-containing protein [Gemmataceae bacterium]